MTGNTGHPKGVRNRHAFRFKLTSAPGEAAKVITAWAKVTFARKPVTLTLTAEHVRKSHEAIGFGNTQLCTMAFCVKGQADRFPHPVEGYVDWQYTRAYVVTKLDRNGLPIACVAYKHHNKIAQDFDKRIGQKKLLRNLEEKGDREIYLMPVQLKTREVGRPRGRNTGERKKFMPRGAALRFAVAQLGGTPA